MSIIVLAACKARVVADDLAIIAKTIEVTQLIIAA